MGVTVDIQALGHRGVGIGRVEGKVVLVPFTAPGDRAEVEVIRRHSSYDEARLVRLLSPSPFRQEPPCPYFGRCGGCQLQHIRTSHQRALKERLFREIISHQGGVAEETVGQILATPEEFEYRSRLELHVIWEREPQLGFNAWGSSEVIPIEKCLLAMEALHPLLAHTRQVLAEAQARGVGRVEMSCDAPGEGTAITLFTGADLSKRTREALGRLGSQVPGLRGLYVASGRGREARFLWEASPGQSGVTYTVPDVSGSGEMTLFAWPGVFRQVNPFANRLLIATALGWIRESPPERALDLYAGMGNLTIPLAVLAGEVVAVEVNPVAVENGEENVLQQGIRSIRWLRGSVGRVTGRLSASGERFDFVILDPPRAGAREILGEIMAVEPARILYISCDPATLGRDLRLLGEDGNYAVRRTHPLDMFPQTFHLESLTLLERR